MKYLALIRAVTFLYQHQRPLKTTTVNGEKVSYIETTLADIEAANNLAAAVLGRSLDELAPQTRNLLLRIFSYVSARAEKDARARESIQFTRRDIREATGASMNQVRDHLARLVEMEYVVPVRVQGAGMMQAYYLLYDGQGVNGESFLLGLTDSATIQRQISEKNGGTTGTWSPQEPHLVPTWSPLGPHLVQGVGDQETTKNNGENRLNRDDDEALTKNTVNRGVTNRTVHRSRTINGHAVLGGVS